jgi:hypothetical protein
MFGETVGVIIIRKIYHQSADGQTQKFCLGRRAQWLHNQTVHTRLNSSGRDVFRPRAIFSIFTKEMWSTSASEFKLAALGRAIIINHLQQKARTEEHLRIRVNTQYFAGSMSYL